MTSSALKRRAREARTWLLDSCFSLWSREGVLPNGLFREALDITHRPVESETVRVRVQGRQTYVFCEARRMGWDDGRADRLIGQGVQALAGPALREDELPGRTILVDGKMLKDADADLYDTAFALFGLAEAARTGHEDALEAARTILGAVDRNLKDETRGGYTEMLPAPDQRLQNPHMHMLEAYLALHTANPDGGHLDRADALIDLFTTRMFDDETGTIAEVFMPDWSKPAAPSAKYVEPGHQFEWVWLLWRHAQLREGNLHPAMTKLYSAALRTLDADGRVFAKATPQGEIVDGSRRTWMQCEALKAHLVMLTLDADEYCDERAVQCFDVLMDEYLTPEGGWIDAYHADGQVAADQMPASTGYHVVLAFAELLRVAGV